MDELNFNYIPGEVIYEITEEGGLLRYTIVRNHFRYGTYVELRKIFVDADAREKGLGKKMTNQLIKIAQGLEIKNIYCRSSATHEEIFGKFMDAMKFKRIPQVDGVVAFEFVKHI